MEVTFSFIFIFVIFIKLAKTGIFKLLLQSAILPRTLRFFIEFFDFLCRKTKNIGQNLQKLLLNWDRYVKFGQALSTRPDLIGKDVCKYLKKLQDDIKPKIT